MVFVSSTDAGSVILVLCINARNSLECAYAHFPEMSLTSRWSAEDHLGVQDRLGSIRLVIAPQPTSAKNGTLQLDVDNWTFLASEIGAWASAARAFL